MYVVYYTDTGWSSEDMRFATHVEATEFMRNMSECGYDLDMRIES